MAVNGPRDFFTFLATPPDIPNDAETLVATLAGIAVGADSLAIDLSGSVVLSIDTDTIAVRLAIYRDSLVGVLVGEARQVVGPDQRDDVNTFTVEGFDYADQMSNGVYVLGVTCSAAAAPTTPSCVKLRAMVTPDGGGTLLD